MRNRVQQPTRKSLAGLGLVGYPHGRPGCRCSRIQQGQSERVTIHAELTGGVNDRASTQPGVKPWHRVFLTDRVVLAGRAGSFFAGRVRVTRPDPTRDFSKPLDPIRPNGRDNLLTRPGWTREVFPGRFIGP